MPVPANISNLSTTAGSNPPTGSETPQEGDNHLRAAYSFIRQISDRIDGTTPANVTVNNLTVNGTLDGVFGSGTYTPTGFTGANMASVTPGKAQWIRAGTQVVVSGTATFDPTAGSATTSATLSLPVAATFASSADLGGVAVSGALSQTGDIHAVEIRADNTNMRAEFLWNTNANHNSAVFRYIYMYEI